MRRMIVLGGGTPVGRRVIERLRHAAEVDSVVGVAQEPSGVAADDDDLEFFAWSTDHRAFADYVVKNEIDTIVDCGLVADRSGFASRPSGADVVSAMYVGAAVADEQSCVRSWVLASSTAYYPSRAYMPLMQRESQALVPASNDRALSIAEAEGYASSVARRLPHVNVAILRLQEIVGPGCRGPLSTLLSRPLVPQIPGFDPAVQLLHVDDAASALGWAAEVELAGIYNVSSASMLRWSEAVRLTGNRRVPVMPLPLGPLEPVLERLGLPVLYASLIDLLRYGQAVDIAKLAHAGWHPENDQARCLSTIA